MDRIVLVTKPTRLEELIREHMTESAAAFALESREQSIVPYQEEDGVYQAAISRIRSQIPNDVQLSAVSREGLPNFLFREKDLILVCGPDGLFVNAAKYAGNQLVVGINPDPKTITGNLMVFAPNEVGSILGKLEKGLLKVEKLPFVKASVDDDRVVWGINDIFIGRRDQVSARYVVSFNERSERQSSSGIIVSTGVGCEGWLKSVAAMVVGLSSRGAGHRLVNLPAYENDELVFVVREPFPSPNTGTSIVTGHVTPDYPLSAISEMPDGGYIFSDGVVEKALPWKAGSTVTVTVGDRYVQRVVK